MMKLTHTICPSCSVGCGINLINKDQKVVGTYPYKRHPVNEGKNCQRGRECFELVNENRIVTPLIKKGKVIDSNWEEALNLAAKEINSHKAGEIGIIGSGNCTNEECEVLKKFADALGVENIGFNAGNIPYIDFETGNLLDVENSKLILIIGDVLKENPLIGRRIIKAKENGAQLITVDYSDITNTGLNSDQYIPVKSIREFLDNHQEVQNKLDEFSTILISKLDNKEEFNEFHELASKSNSKIIPVMNDCNSRGAMNSLPALNEEELKALIERVNLLYVVGDDPASYAEKSFKNLDFLITQNVTHNKTTSLSDIALPSACWAEKNGTFTNTTGYVQKIREAVPTQSEALDDMTIITQIAGKLGIKL